jgi:ethanolamine ammonia-lyase large subunit
MGVPYADDVMLNYQSTSFHDALGIRQLFGLQPAPEFLAWLEEVGIFQNQRPVHSDRAIRQQLVQSVKTITDLAL